MNVKAFSLLHCYPESTDRIKIKFHKKIAYKLALTHKILFNIVNVLARTMPDIFAITKLIMCTLARNFTYQRLYRSTVSLRTKS